MLRVVHSLQEINKQTKWGYNKAIWGPIFKIQMLVVPNAEPQIRLDDKRWNRVNLCF